MKQIKIISALSPLLCLIGFIIVVILESQNVYYENYAGEIGKNIFIPLLIASTVWMIYVHRKSKWLYRILLPIAVVIGLLIAFVSFIIWRVSVG